MKKKLLLIGSRSVHIYNYIKLIDGYFDEILLITNTKDKDNNINSIEVDFRLSFNIPFSIKKIKNIINDFKPTIIHIHQANSYAFLTLFAYKKNIPVVLTAWGSDILINPKNSFLYKKALEYTLKKVDIVTSDSLYMANEILKYYPGTNTKIVNFGVEIEADCEEKESVIYSNRLHNKLYNIDKIIYAFKNFVQDNKEWKLVLGATGNQTEKLKKLVSQLKLQDSVEFIGWVDSSVNNKMYQKAKIYISIPSSDATSISLLEAISCNCICFVSNLPSNCEHILDNINGFIETDLNNIDFEKYKTIDLNLLKSVNSIRKNNYTKSINRKKFLQIYDSLIMRSK